jgi:MFS family permease
MVKFAPSLLNQPLRAFHHRNFRLFAFGQILSLAGTRIHEVAAGWLMWQLTGSAAWLGALALAEITPRILMWPASGLVADRMDRRRIATIFQTLSAVEAGLLAILQAFGMVTPLILMVTAALLGLNNAFWQPVRMALIPRLVPSQELPTAVALSSVLANVARVIGPILSGPAMIWGGVSMAFALNSVSFFAVVVALQMMRLTKQDTMPRRHGESHRGVWHGMAVVVAHPGIGPLFLLIGIFAVTVRPIADLLPAFAEKVFDKGPGGFAALISVMGAGALLSGLLLSWRSALTGLTTILALFGILGATATMLFALTSNFTLALVCMGLIGVGVTGKNIVAQTLVQSALDDSVRGRVFSLYAVVFNSAPAVGALLMGYAADWVGIAAPVVGAAVIGLAASTGTFVRRRKLAPHLEVAAKD